MAEISYRFILVISMILLGYLLKRFGVFKNSDGDALTRLAFNITLPAIIISSFSDFQFEWSYAVYPVIGFAYGFFIFGASLLFYRKFSKRVKGTLTMPLLGLNIGLFAVPLVQVIWGDLAVKYLLLIDCGNAFIVFGLCYFVAAFYADDRADANARQIMKAAMKSIPFLVYIVTLLLKAFGIYYPKFVVDIADIAAKANTPVAMIALGIFLSFTFTRSQMGKMVLFWAMKYLIGIASGLAIYFFAPLDVLGRSVILLALILPSSFATIVYAVDFKYDTRFVGALVNSTIIISIITIWVIALLGITTS
ncbi:MAG: AEC family transporter [Saccharofermentanales bacterium]